MKTRLLPLLTALLCTTAALADVARPVLQSSTTKALVDDLATGAKKMTLSASGTLEWVNGATLTGASHFRTAAGLGIGVNVQAYDSDLTTWAGISPSANVQTLLGSSNYAAFKTSLSLNNVENTALSTWAGSANMTTLGTINTGVWHGTPLGLAYLASGGATDGQLLGFSDGAWVPVTFSTGLTVGTTNVAGGTSGRLLMNNAGVLGELALGTDVATALGNAINASGGVLTYSLIGTSGTKIPLLNAANTWSGTQTFTDSIIVNKSGQSETGGLAVLTDPANAGVRALFLIPPADGTRIYLGKSGQTAYVLNMAYCTGFESFPSSISRVGSLGITLFGGGSINLDADYSSGAVNVSTTTTSGVLRINNTFTASTNYEGLELGWSSNVAHLWTIKGSGGGSARDLVLGRDGATKITIGATTTDHAQPVKLPSYIVSGLPSASTCGAGSMAFVTDATATTAYSTVAGGGSNKVLVISDGTNWIIH